MKIEIDSQRERKKRGEREREGKREKERGRGREKGRGRERGRERRRGRERGEIPFLRIDSWQENISPTIRKIIGSTGTKF